MRLRTSIVGGILAALVAACSSHTSSSLLPSTQDTNNGASPQLTQSQPGLQTESSTTSSTISLQGSIAGITTGKSFILNSTVGGKVPVTVTSSTVVTTTGGLLSAGMYVYVQGTGSTSTSVTATSVSSSSGTATPPPVSGSVPAHLLTADYLGAPDGTTSVSPTTAAPYLNWAQTGVSAVNAIHAAGIKTQIYLNPNRVQSNDSLYKTTASSGFSNTCTSSRVYDTFGSTTQYVMNPASSALHSSYASLVNTMFAGLNVDAVFEDNAGPLSAYGTGNFKAAMPCSYSDSAWLSGELSLEASISKPTIFNGLSGLNGHSPSLSIGLLNNSSTIGGTYEHCISDDSHPEMAAWAWQAIENTQIQVVAKHKYFFCMARNLASASTSQQARIYVLASLLLTYDPNYSVIWDEFATPNGFHVMPESGFVALQPLKPQPTDISQLDTSGGIYVREYAACYYRGRALGKCAAVVNGDYYTHTRPTLTGYTHSLTVSGYDVLEGGTVGFTGALPPVSMPAYTSAILLP